MSNKEKAEQLKIAKVETKKKYGNIFFGCSDCNYQWNADEYPNQEQFKEGEVCPQCESKNIVAI